LINVFEPDLGSLELDALGATISSKWIGKGKKEEAFRNAFGSLVGVPGNLIVTYNSCTEAFFQLFEFLNLPQGSEVVLPTVSFVGVANSVAASSLRINFCDINPNTGNPDLADVQSSVTANTRAVIFQHYGGNMGEIEKIAEFCRQNGILLIEDAAAALGSTFNGKSAGTFGDFGLWSFDAMKSISCGDGGALYSKSSAVADSLRIQGYLGLDFTSGLDRSTESNDRWWNFEVKNFGRRSILNDLAASIGLVQLSRFAEKSEKRNHLSKLYSSSLVSIPGVKVLVQESSQTTGHSHYFLPLWVESRRDDLANFLKTNDVYTTFRYLPLHRQEIYESDASLPSADEFAEHVLLLPMHTNLKPEEVEMICDLIKTFYNE
jgi:dTDP-4-amino-4,6-dideoxygalactose transaminase